MIVHSMIVAGRAARSTSSPSRVPAFAIQSPNCAENADSGPPACSRDFRYRFDRHVISAVRARDREVAGSCHRLDPRGGSTFNIAVFSIPLTVDCGPSAAAVARARKWPVKVSKLSERVTGPPATESTLQPTIVLQLSTPEPMGRVSKTARRISISRANEASAALGRCTPCGPLGESLSRPTRR